MRRVDCTSSLIAKGRASRRWLRLAAPILLAGTGGCASLGAKHMDADRFDYAMQLRETNKEQLLLNIVAMRYGDAPAFLEVSSVISQYTREGQLRTDLDLDPPSGARNGSFGGSILLRETPTVTYAPLTGERFARSLLAPIPPASILAMIEAGWAPEFLLRLSARSINGISNGGHDPLFSEPSDPKFLEVISALGRLQRSGGLNIHVDRNETGFITRAQLGQNLSDQDRADLDYLKRALNLPGDGSDLTIRFAGAQSSKSELAIGSRSMFEILTEMAQGVEVPAQEDSAGRAGSAHPNAKDAPRLMRIRSGTSRPDDPHVAIRYRNLWFWIDGTDGESKRMFLIAQILLSMADTSSGANAPLVTIPTG